MDRGKVLMEIKTPGGIPLWMTNFLTEQKIYKTSFSKYGAAYKDMMPGKDNKNHNYLGGILYA